MHMIVEGKGVTVFKGHCTNERMKRFIGAHTHQMAGPRAGRLSTTQSVQLRPMMAQQWVSSVS
jgi:hypothetical protein